MNAGAIGRRLDALAEAGEALRARPAQERLAALEQVLSLWRDPGAPWCDALAAALPEAAGFHPRTVHRGLEVGLGAWPAGALEALFAAEVPPGARAPRSTAALLAGSIPLPSFLSLLAPLALGSPVLAKTASRDPVSAPLFARSVAEVDAALGRCIDTVDFPGSDRAAGDALMAAECVVATGSDETIAAVAARVRAPSRLVAHGHKLSIAALGPEALRGGALHDAAEGLALDVALWDQLGCLSPIAVYAATSRAGALDALGDALADALARAEERWPRGRVGAAAAADLAQERAGAEIRAAAGAAVSLRGGEGAGFSVVCEADARPRPAPLHRFVRLHPVPDAAALLDAVAPLARHLAGVALAGFGRAAADLADRLAACGATWVCPPGRLQAPPLGWRRGGLAVLGSLLA